MRPVITKNEIIAWAKAHLARTGQWPRQSSGRVIGADSLTWEAVNGALKDGYRGLPGGDSLSRLLRPMMGSDWMLRGSRLTRKLILEWADDHFRQTGDWPTQDSGPVSACPTEKWSSIVAASQSGARGLGKGPTLRELLMRERGASQKAWFRPRLTPQMILTWADAHKLRAGKWPTELSGHIPNSKGETWQKVNAALAIGGRGLERSSISRLLAAHRATRDRGNLPPLTLGQILTWADAHHGRTGKWPSRFGGAIPGTREETWLRIDRSLNAGGRGMPKTSLPAILNKHRGVRRWSYTPRLSDAQVLDFVGDHLRRTGRWPIVHGGPIPNSSGDSWVTINYALSRGIRGLSKYRSLCHFLFEYFGRETGSMRVGKHSIQLPYRSKTEKVNLTDDELVRWATAFKKRTGKWPTVKSGPIAEAPGDTWGAVAQSLYHGKRGLEKRGTSLARLLAERVGRRNQSALLKLTIGQILLWADEHYERTGLWPKNNDGVIPGSGGESWQTISIAAEQGLRGLPGTWTLSDLLLKKRGKRNRAKLPKLSLGKIRRWIREHVNRGNRWPVATSGAIHGTNGETWNGIDKSLRYGLRGLSRGSTLSSLSLEMRGLDSAPRGRVLTLPEIILWARAFYRRHGEWPERFSGRIPDAPGENWHNVNEALRRGYRGITKRTTLRELLLNEPTPRKLV